MSSASLQDTLDACLQRSRDMDAPLSARLKSFADDLRTHDAIFAEVIDRLVERLETSGAGSGAPRPGDIMPPFVLPDETGRLVSLGELLQGGPVVVAFHRGHWCPYCRISADALAGLEPRVRQAGGQIVVITPEVQRFNRQLKSDAGSGYPLLSDIDSGYALELGLAFRIDDTSRTAMEKRGRDLPTFQASESWTLPIPATFVVGRDGRIVASYVDPDYRKRMEIEDILAALER
jgi:peroxiredoxin